MRLTVEIETKNEFEAAKQANELSEKHGLTPCYEISEKGAQSVNGTGFKIIGGNGGKLSLFTRNAKEV